MKVLIVDDHSLIRVYLKHYIEEHFPHFDVSALQKIDEDLPEQIVALTPDLLILDISLDFLDTLDFFKYLKIKLPKTFFVIYTMHNITSYINFFHKQGAHAYVLKEDAESELRDVIETVLTGRIVFPKDLNIKNNDYRLNQLSFSALEKRLLSAMLETLNTEEIAAKLSLKTPDVLQLKHTLLEKTGASNTQELLVHTVEYNWIR